MEKKLVLFFLSICFIANSQSNFQRNLYQTNSSGNVENVVYCGEYNTSTFIIKNLKGLTPQSGFSSLTKFTTTTGNVTSSKTFSISGYDLKIKHVVQKNQMLYIVASLTNSLNATTGCIIKYNLSSNTSSWRRTLNINQTDYTLDKIAYDKDKYLYALGSDSTLKSLNRLFIVKLDTNGTLNWIKTIGDSKVYQKPSMILYNGLRELYVTSIGNYLGKKRSVVLRLDSSGLVLKSKALFTSALYQNSVVSFGGNFSTIQKGKLLSVDKTIIDSLGNVGPILIRTLDTNLNAISTKILDGINIKQIYANNTNLLLTGLTQTTSLFGFRTMRLDSNLTVVGAHYFKKIKTTSDSSSSACYINSNNNSFHFFKSTLNDTIFTIKSDSYESVGCRDTTFTPSIINLTYSDSLQLYAGLPISGTLSTISIPVASITYSSSSLCSALTTNVYSNIGTQINVLVYPNPSSGILNLNIDGLSNQMYKIQLLNTLGEVLKDDTSLNTEFTYDISNLPNGVYFMKISCDNKNRLVKVLKS